MAGLAKGLAIIELFASTHDCLTVTSAAEEVGISRASARRCLLTLADLGYLSKSGSRFLPTPKMLRLGASYSTSAQLPQVAQPHLEAARDELKESISLSVLEAGYSVFVARAEAARLVSTAVRLGSKLPAYASATGRVLLSTFNDVELDRYLSEIQPEKLTSATVTDKNALRRIIRRAGLLGVAETDQELEEGMVSIAVPVTDATGAMVAAMSMSASSARVSIDRMKSEMLPSLMKYAEALSRSL